MAKLAYNELTQFLDGNGAPYSGAQLFTYEAGSSTKETTYQDDGSVTPNSNPILCDANGRIPYAIWLTEGQAYKFILSPSTDTDPPVSPIWTLDDITGINDVAALQQSEWVAFNGTPTYVSATSFTLVGDQTTEFHVGRRLKTTNSGGTAYSTIKTSTFGAATTITVVNDSTTLDAGLSDVSYGILSATNPSTSLLADTYPIVSGSSDKTKKYRLEVDGFTTDVTRVATPPDYDHRVMSQTHGADIASATGAGTLNLDTATGDLVDVTGTTTITAITLAEGKDATVRFTGVLILTNGASLVLPGGMNITTAAGDVANFRGYAAGVVRCVNYQALAPAPVAGMSKLASGTVASAATLDVVMTSYTAFRDKLFVFDIIPATDGTSLLFRVSSNGGSTYDDTASNYQYTLNAIDDNANSVMQAAASGGGATNINLSLASIIGNGATEGISGEIFMVNTTSTAKWPRFRFRSDCISADATPRDRGAWGVGTRNAAQDTDAFRLLFSSGDIASGSWTLYGLN